jgi:ParB/RepB/Spo0J family partition protein
VRKLDEREVVALALIENLQREDLNPVEEARAYQRLSEQDGLTQQEIATFVDKSRSHVANLMRLLSLPEEVLDMVQRDEISMGHARAGNPARSAAHRARSRGEGAFGARCGTHGQARRAPGKRAAQGARGA